MGHKRKTDIWNEIADTTGERQGVEADQFVKNIAHNKEGISADRQKFIFDETTTPKLFPSNRKK